MVQVTAAEAARELHVTRRRVGELLNSGELAGRRLSGGDWLVELDSVHERNIMATGGGRPWAEEFAWAAVRALSGERTGFETRARTRLRATGVLTLGRRIAQTIVVRRFNARSIESVTRTVHLTGESAVNHIDTTLRGNAKVVHGYVDNLEQFVHEHDLVADHGGNVALYTFRSGVARVHEATPKALVAVDCMRSINTRIRSAGERALTEMRSEWLASTTR